MQDFAARIIQRAYRRRYLDKLQAVCFSYLNHVEQVTNIIDNLKLIPDMHNQLSKAAHTPVAIIMVFPILSTTL